MPQRITIVRIRKDNPENINEELRWLGISLGLFGLRDRDSSCFRVFITLLKRTKKNEAVTSDEIADKLKLSRGTVVHHLNNLIESGLVIRTREGYLLRENTLERLIKEIKRDVETSIEEIENAAKEIDQRLGL